MSMLNTPFPMQRRTKIRCLFYLPLLLAMSWVDAQEALEQNVIVQLQWKHQFEFAGHYAAIHKGFYARRGLHVELREYREGLDVIGEVLSGRAHYGLSSSAIVQARLEGRPVKLLANYFKRMPLVILARPEIPEEERQEWKAQSASERAATTQSQLATARSELDAAVQKLERLKSQKP